MQRKQHTKPPDLSIVVPLFNEEDNVRPLLQAIAEAVGDLRILYEVILIDDGSQDRTWETVKEATISDPNVKGVALSRNFGHQNAIFAGLHYTSGKAILTMDGDLQHPPKVIPDMYAAWRNGSKVVETRRLDSRDVSFLKRTSSNLFYRLFSTLSGLPMNPGSSDFRLMDREVAEVIREMKDSDLFLRGISQWVGFPRTTILYQAAVRHAGDTKFSLDKMVRFAVASLFSFSIIPLRLGIWLGLLTSGLAFTELVYILIRFLQGDSVPGWASTLTVISFMFGILFVLVGIIGAYLGSIFETVKNRPRFLVNEMTGFDRDL